MAAILPDILPAIPSATPYGNLIVLSAKASRDRGHAACQRCRVPRPRIVLRPIPNPSCCAPSPTHLLHSFPKPSCCAPSPTHLLHSFPNPSCCAPSPTRLLHSFPNLSCCAPSPTYLLHSFPNPSCCAPFPTHLLHPIPKPSCCALSPTHLLHSFPNPSCCAPPPTHLLHSFPNPSCCAPLPPRRAAPRPNPTVPRPLLLPSCCGAPPGMRPQGPCQRRHQPVLQCRRPRAGVHGRRRRGVLLGLGQRDADHRPGAGPCMAQGGGGRRAPTLYARLRVRCNLQPWHPTGGCVPRTARRWSARGLVSAQSGDGLRGGWCLHSETMVCEGVGVCTVRRWSARGLVSAQSGDGLRGGLVSAQSGDGLRGGWCLHTQAMVCKQAIHVFTLWCTRCFMCSKPTTNFATKRGFSPSFKTSTHPTLRTCTFCTCTFLSNAWWHAPPGLIPTASQIPLIPPHTTRYLLRTVQEFVDKRSIYCSAAQLARPGSGAIVRSRDGRLQHVRAGRVVHEVAGPPGGLASPITLLGDDAVVLAAAAQGCVLAYAWPAAASAGTDVATPPPSGYPQPPPQTIRLHAESALGLAGMVVLQDRGLMVTAG
eukprot:364363-Chlamydomonas_euryale.AAC.7